MFADILRAQQIKTLRSRVLWVELTALAAITALLIVLTNTITELQLDAPASMAGQLSEMLEHAAISTLGHVLVVVLVGAVMAHEYAWRSLHLWLSQGVSRTSFLWAKFAAVLVPVAFFFVVTAAVTAPIAAGFTQAEHGTIGPVLGEVADLLRTTLLGVYGLLPFAALALLLAVAGRSMLVAIGGGLALTILAETMVVQVLAMIGGRALDVIAYLPGPLVYGVLGREVDGAIYDPHEPWLAAVLIGVYTVGLMAAATVVFQRQDLSD